MWLDQTQHSWDRNAHKPIQMNLLWDCILPYPLKSNEPFEVPEERGKEGQTEIIHSGARPSTLLMLRAAWLPHSLTVVTWVDGQRDNVQAREDACHGWPWLSSSHSKGEDAALVREPGRNRYNEGPGTWAQFTGFCPLSPVTTVLTFPSSGMFLQQLKIVSKNVSQRKEKAKVTQCWLTHFVN